MVRGPPANLATHRYGQMKRQDFVQRLGINGLPPGRATIWNSNKYSCRGNERIKEAPLFKTSAMMRALCDVIHLIQCEAP